MTRRLAGDALRAAMAAGAIAGITVAAVVASPLEVREPSRTDSPGSSASTADAAATVVASGGVEGDAAATATTGTTDGDADPVVRAAPPPDQLPGPSEPAGAESIAVRPVSVRVPAIALTAPLDGLGVTADGTIEIPADATRAGWLTTSRTPGEPGPAVIAGHVDARNGPGVFARLSELDPSDAVVVALADGTIERFVVTHVRQYPKATFPTGEVYGSSPAPALRLITCGGSVDPTSGRYRDNVVVYGTLDR